MIQCSYGNKTIRTQCLSHRISYRLDTEISPPYPKSWHKRVSQETFSVLRSLPSCEIIEYNIQADHIHMEMIIPPSYKVSEVIGRIKCQTASRLQKKVPWLSQVYWKENIVWSPGYFVSTIGLNEKSILDYVRHEETQDLVQAKLELY